MKLNGTLPKGDADGLSAVEAPAIKAVAKGSPKPIVAIVILEPAKLDEDLHTRQKELRLSIRRVEALLAEDVEAATRLLQRSFESRTGQATLPIELENDIKDALKGVDTYVPETDHLEGVPEGSLVGPPDGGYGTMLVKDLRDRLKRRGLDHSQGTKTELIARLEAADAAADDAPKGNVTNLFSDGSGYEPVDADVPPAEDVEDAEERAWNAAAPDNDEDPDETDIPVGEVDDEPMAEDE